MTTSSWGLLVLLLVALVVLGWPLGRFIAALCDGRLPRWMERVETPLFKLAGVVVIGSTAVISLDVLYGAGGLIAVILFAYLVFALICAEEF